MSSLPQRKKSAEEIAQLRESLGIAPPPGHAVASPAPEPPPERIVATTHEAVLEHEEPSIHLEPEPANVAMAHPHEPHSLKRSERMTAPPPEPAEAAYPDGFSGSPRPAKRVRSLRKSEQGPIRLPKPVASQADALTPFHRHSQEELAEIRRRAALSQLGAPPPPVITHAHPVLVALGYLAAAASAGGIWFYRIPLAASASGLAVSILVAALICRRNPYSRHHAAFIGIAVLLVAAFGALEYFPQLTFKHGP